MTKLNDQFRDATKLSDAFPRCYLCGKRPLDSARPDQTITGDGWREINRRVVCPECRQKHDRMKTYVKVRVGELDGGLIVPLDDAAGLVAEELRVAEAGQDLSITILEMSEIDYLTLQEFEGW